VLELVPDDVRMVWPSLLVESLEVVSRWPCLTFVVVHGNCDAHHAGAARLSVVVVVIVGRGRSPLRMLLVPLLANLDALPGALDGDVERCLLVTTWGHIPASWRKMKFSCLVAGGVLGGDVA
jgi:hypothetical protein